MSQATRLKHIDIAKGIGILLVVFYHIPFTKELSTHNYIGNYVAIFYMILFFCLSGCFYKPTHLKERFLRLFVPWLSFMVYGIVLYHLKYKITHHSIDSNWIIAPFIGKMGGGKSTTLVSARFDRNHIYNSYPTEDYKE